MICNLRSLCQCVIYKSCGVIQYHIQKSVRCVMLFDYFNNIVNSERDKKISCEYDCFEIKELEMNQATHA